MKTLLLFLTLLLAIHCTAQNAAKPCSSPECAQFDFWLGDWVITYGDTVHATNSITRELDGCVTHEHFKDAPYKSYLGESWSMYNPKLKKWQQTWVDNSGAYIALTGEFKNGEMLLFTEPYTKPDGKTAQNRMRYHNIKPNSFNWEWDITTDGGKTWVNNWSLQYDRKN
jgi:hypothetical protein